MLIVQKHLQAVTEALLGKESAPIGELLDEIARLQDENARRREALEESVKLQTHYAKLLNMYDGGKRIGFDNADAWLSRLEALKGGADDE